MSYEILLAFVMESRDMRNGDVVYRFARPVRV